MAQKVALIGLLNDHKQVREWVLSMSPSITATMCGRNRQNCFIKKQFFGEMDFEDYKIMLSEVSDFTVVPSVVATILRKAINDEEMEYPGMRLYKLLPMEIQHNPHVHEVVLFKENGKWGLSANQKKIESLKEFLGTSSDIEKGVIFDRIGEEAFYRLTKVDEGADVRKISTTITMTMLITEFMKGSYHKNDIIKITTP